MLRVKVPRDLIPMTQDSIISYLRTKYNPKSILLHGSRARGDAVKDSDYDLDPLYDACFVDPDTANIRAMRIYEKAGFNVFKTFKEGKRTWMVRWKI